MKLSHAAASEAHDNQLAAAMYAHFFRILRDRHLAHPRVQTHLDAVKAAKLAEEFAQAARRIMELEV
jgi:hypothetical protein